MQMNRRATVVALVVAALITSSCTGDDDDATTTTDGEAPATTSDEAAPSTTDAGDELDGEGLELGFIQAPVGLFGILGAAQADALVLAVADVAAGGGVLGGPLTIAEERPEPDRSVMSVFDDLVDRDIRLIVGPSSSDEALAILPELAAADAVVCGASTTAPGLPTTEGADGRFVRTTFDDDIVAVNAFERIRQQTAAVLGRAPKVTIAARGDAYGERVANSLASLLDLVGIDVEVQRYEPENQLLGDFAAAVAATDPDVAVVISLAEGPALARQIVDAGLPAERLLGLDGLASPRFTGKANISDPAAYERLTVVGATGPLSFLTRLLDLPETSGEVLYAAQAYDCAIAFALAVESVGSTDPAAVSAALRDVTGGGTICTTYGECAELLRAGEDIDYDGPSGPVDFTDEGEPGGGRFITARLIDGVLTVVADLRITLDEIRSQVAPRIAGFIGDIQVALTELGYYTGPIDGQQNDEFAAAVAAFQTDSGLEPTGELDAATIAAIQEALAERGSILGASVREVQQLLTELGYYTGPIDGVFSVELSDAIKAFQIDLGVEPTGILDEATLRAIYQAGIETGTPVEPPPTTTTTVPATTTTTTTLPPDATTTTTVATETTTTTTTIPVDSILGVLQATPEFSELVALLARDDLADVRTALSDPTAALTLFAPVNGELPAGAAGLPADQIIELLLYHVVDDALAAADLATQSYPTLLDRGSGAEEVAIDVDVSPPTVGGVPVDPDLLDLAAGDGFVHGLAGVLTPPAP